VSNRALEAIIDDIVVGNRILAHHGVVDAFGHVSARHPDRPDRFLISCAKAPELITAEDIQEYELDGTDATPNAKKGYLERYIHGAIYEARPEVQSVTHSHSRTVLPFTVTGEKLRPITHSCASIGHEVPVWDAQDQFGDTTLLVSDMAMGRDLAKTLGKNNSALMRGHGSTVSGTSVRAAVYTTMYLEMNAEVQLNASRFPPIKFLSKGEVDLISSRLEDAKPAEGYDRAWSYWAQRAGCEARPRFVG
jgi:ribulose-5-phosphate 4-epimerase/fuculose-1-phosphate aldolase